MPCSFATRRSATPPRGPERPSPVRSRAGSVERLHGVDHADTGRSRSSVAQTVVEVRLGEDSNLAAPPRRSARSHLRSDSSPVTRATLRSPLMAAQRHEQQRRLPDAGLAAHEDERGGDEPAAENAVELGHAGGDALCSSVSTSARRSSGLACAPGLAARRPSAPPGAFRTRRSRGTCPTTSRSCTRILSRRAGLPQPWPWATHRRAGVRRPRAPGRITRRCRTDLHRLERPDLFDRLDELEDPWPESIHHDEVVVERWPPRHEQLPDFQLILDDPDTDTCSGAAARSRSRGTAATRLSRAAWSTRSSRHSPTARAPTSCARWSPLLTPASKDAAFPATSSVEWPRPPAAPASSA